MSREKRTSATQFCGSAMVKVPTGGRKKKLKHRTARIEPAIASVSPQVRANHQHTDQIGESGRRRIDGYQPKEHERDAGDQADRRGNPRDPPPWRLGMETQRAIIAKNDRSQDRRTKQGSRNDALFAPPDSHRRTQTRAIALFNGFILEAWTRTPLPPRPSASWPTPFATDRARALSRGLTWIEAGGERAEALVEMLYAGSPCALTGKSSA